MRKGRNLWDYPVVRHRLQVGGYARIHGNISQTARRFNHDRKTIRDYLRRYEEFERTGDLSVFLNRPRGDSHRTADWIEELIVGYYQEEDTKRTCPNIARALEEDHGITLTRQTVYNILRRRGVWVPPRRGEKPITPFEKPLPNMLWQVDLIELEETCLGKVYAVVVIDDHSRYLLALRFFLTKEQEGVLYTLYLAFCEYGLPSCILVDRGGQFYSALQGAESRFQEVMARLGIEVQYTSRPQTKGKVEKLIQFIERDFLGVQRNRVKSLDDLNTRAELWRRRYNHREHEGIGKTPPAGRYRPSPHRVGAEALWDAFAKEERRKVRRDGTISLWGKRYPVPKEYVGWHVWVRIFYNLVKVCVGAENRVIATYPCPP